MKVLEHPNFMENLKIKVCKTFEFELLNLTSCVFSLNIFKRS